MKMEREKMDEQKKVRRKRNGNQQIYSEGVERTVAGKSA